ncbi:MAG: flagellar filament capping protein FliD [Defluviitaleaceae bacterium]|nr:flagellar filament capping protein FliD [Defluviitaleaceae bacterium]
MFTNQLRFTGFSGMDVQGMVQQMMRAESFRLDRLHQRRTRLTWQQESLQGLTTTLRTLQRNHLDFTNPANNLRASATFNAFSFNATLNGLATGAVTATGGTDSIPGTYSIRVNELATQDIRTFSPTSGNLTGAFTPGNFMVGDSFNIRVDNGTTRAITFNAAEARMMNSGSDDVIQAMLNRKLGEIYGFATPHTRPSVTSTTPLTGLDLSGYTEFEVEVNGGQVIIDITDIDTAEDLVNKLNEELGHHGVTFSYEGGNLNVRSEGVSEVEFFGGAGTLAHTLGLTGEILNIVTAPVSRFVNFQVTSSGANRQISLNPNTGHTATVTAGAAANNPRTTQFMGERDIRSGTGIVWTSGNLASTINNLMGSGNSLSFNVDGQDDPVHITAQNIIDRMNLNPYNINANTFVSALNAELRDRGITGITFSADTTGTYAGRLRMTSNGTQGVEVIGNPNGLLANANGANGNLPATTTANTRISSTLSDMGFASGQSTNMNLNRTLGEVFGVVGGQSIPGDSTTTPPTPPDHTPNHTFTINGQTVRYHEDMTVRQFMDAIAATGQANLIFDNLNGEFRLTSRGTGVESNLNISGGTAQLGGMIASLTGGPNHTAAQDAEIQVTAPNGQAHNLTRSTNTFSFNGINFTVHQETEATDPPVVISVQRDVERPLGAIRDFVESFNSLMTELRTMHNTPRLRPPGARFEFFEPLTDAQRREMTDREVSEWEENARVGLMHRDPILREIMDMMRTNMFNSVELPNGSRIALFEIGITFSREGLMEIDEARLQSALENRLDDVVTLFTRDPGSGTANNSNINARLAQGGIANRMNDIMNLFAGPGINGRLVQRAGSPDHHTQNDMLSRIQDMDRNIERMNQTLMRREQAHFARFAAMEQAIMRSNQQIDMLWSMMGQ